MSGSYLGVSGICLGEYRCHLNHKQLNRSRDIKLLPFLPVTSNGQKVLNFGVSVGVSGGCLEGVSRVSGWSLSDSGYNQRGPNIITSVKSLISVM